MHAQVESACTARQTRQILETLEARGARSFDAISCDCVRTLITRSAALEGRAASLLLARAHDHADRLGQRFDAARAQTESKLAAAEQVYGSLPAERAAFERDELGVVRRKLRRLDSGCGAVAPAHRKHEHERCANEYEAALAELSAAFVVASAVDTMPEHAGPYNPLRIATDLLACIGAVSPIYLTTQLNRLEELASMLTLPELPAPSVSRTKPPPARPPSRSKLPSPKHRKPAKRSSQPP